MGFTHESKICSSVTGAGTVMSAYVLGNKGLFSLEGGTNRLCKPVRTGFRGGAVFHLSQHNRTSQKKGKQE